MPLSKPDPPLRGQPVAGPIPFLRRLAAWRGTPYLLVTSALLLLRGPTLHGRVLSIDEPSYIVQAARVDTLERFAYAFSYRVETKTQLGLIPYLLAAALDPQNAIVLVHLLGLIPTLLTGYLLVALARRFFGTPWPGVAAALIWGLYLLVGPAYPPDSPYGYNYLQTPRLEYYQTPAVLLSLYAFLWAGEQAPQQPGRARWALAGAGAAWALTVLIKPGSILLGPFYVLALLAIWQPGMAPRARLPGLLQAAGALVVGAAVPVGLLFAPYLANLPALAEVKYNLLDIGGGYGKGLPVAFRLLTLLLGVPPLVLGAALLVPGLVGWRRWDQEARPMTRRLRIILLAAPAILSGYLTGRALPNYLIPAMAPLALALAGYLTLALRGLARDSGPRRAWAVGAGLAALYLGVNVPALGAAVQLAQVDTYFAQSRRHFDLDGLVAYINTHTRPDDSLWVYYNAPELYTLTGRRPTTRDPVGVWVAFIWQESLFQRIAADLAAEPPALIIGITDPPAPEPWAGPLIALPQVGAWITQHYRCDATLLRGATVCTRAGTTPRQAPPGESRFQICCTWRPIFCCARKETLLQ